jgi:hypothetical protein
VPVSQIHSLSPSEQPKAWLNILASSETSLEEKNEAMEEIIILGKEKQRARILLENGVLDALLWTIKKYLDKVTVLEDSIAVASMDQSERFTARLAAQCCMTLGKSHCAAMHTEGDLLLMSLYDRGTVPEERQVAQMLHEVPHHTRTLPPSSAASHAGSNVDNQHIFDSNVEFIVTLQQMSLSQAEDFARSIQAIAEGRI